MVVVGTKSGRGEKVEYGTPLTPGSQGKPVGYIYERRSGGVAFAPNSDCGRGSGSSGSSGAVVDRPCSQASLSNAEGAYGIGG